MADDPYRLPGAIRRRVAETPALLALVPGGAFAGQGDQATPRPYASLTGISRTAHDWDTSGARWVHEVVQADIHAAGLEECAAAAHAWEQAFHPNLPPPAIRGCAVKRVWCANSFEHPRDRQALQATRDHVISVEVHAELVQYPPG